MAYSLNVFELLTATYAGDTEYFNANGDDFQLPAHWKQVQGELAEHPMLQRRGQRLPAGRLSGIDRTTGGGVDRTSTRSRSPRPAVSAATSWTSRCRSTSTGRRRSCRRCTGPPGSSLARESTVEANLPYRGQITSLAAIRTVLGTGTDSREAEEKITRWYWCGVLGEQYGGSPDTRLPRDLEQVAGWVRGGPEPASVTEANFPSARLNTMSSRISAAYKGVLALLLRQGAIDWTYSKEPINPTIFEDQQVNRRADLPQGVVRQARRQPGAHGQHRQQDAADPPHPSDHGNQPPAST